MSKHKRHILTPRDWMRLSDDDLLNVRVQDLGVSIEGSRLEHLIQRLYAELDGKGIVFRPGFYLADEWLCPDKVPVIGIPFYLAHSRLKKLEKKLMLQVEGGTDSSCMKLLRHETGHAINYAYMLFKRTRWRELFGKFSEQYSTSYTALPYSKRFVTHLRDNYAQAHPDEDFAETFAVWLTPDGNWAERYRGWPALRKLLYVERVMKRIGHNPPQVTRRETPWSAARMRSTLRSYYERRQRVLGEEFPGFFDPPLYRIFVARQGNDDEREPASAFLLRRRSQIINTVAKWTGERKYDVHSLIRKLIQRTRRLDMFLPAGEADALSDVTAFVTAVMDNVNRFRQETKP